MCAIFRREWSSKAESVFFFPDIEGLDSESISLFLSVNFESGARRSVHTNYFFSSALLAFSGFPWPNFSALDQGVLQPNFDFFFQINLNLSG